MLALLDEEHDDDFDQANKEQKWGASALVDFETNDAIEISDDSLSKSGRFFKLSSPLTRELRQSTFSSRKEKLREQRKEFIRSLCLFLSVLSFVCLLTQSTIEEKVKVLKPTQTRHLREPQGFERFQLLKEVLLSVTDEELLDESISPQHKALIWLTYDDQLRLSIPSNEMERRKLIQRYALACLYFSTNGPKWIYKSNFLSKLDECEWNEIDENLYFNGVGGCGPDGNVTMVALWGNKLDGEIPEELAMLKKLKILSLHSNSLYGTVPEELQNLNELETFYLHGNQFYGNIDFMCRNYDILDIRSDCNKTQHSIKCPCCEVCCNEKGECYDSDA